MNVLIIGIYRLAGQPGEERPQLFETVQTTTRWASRGGRNFSYFLRP